MEQPTPRPVPAYPGPVTDENIRAIFAGAGDFYARELRCGNMTLYVYMIDGLVSGGDASEYILKPISQDLKGDSPQALYEAALAGEIYNSVADPCEDLDTVARKLVNGFGVVLFPGAGALAFEIKTGEKRSPGPPEVEATVKGPKDAFTETVRTNTSLLRRHLRTPDLRLHETVVGRRSLTNVTVAYIEGLTDPELVERMKARLDEIDIDGFLSPAAVEEYVTGSRKTAFPLMQYTERTDKFAQGLLAGRVGLLADGLPLGYLAPADLGYLMTSPEDRGTDYLSASFLRILRYLALGLTLILPGLYAAMAAFHQEMIPLPLLRAIIESKENVPFPTAVEVLGLLLSFELLQEAGIHLPQPIGQTVSIVGGIVVGTAAVEAKLVSPAALIVVAAAGICGFALPSRDFSEAVRLWRLALALMGSLWGLFGVTFGFLALLVHLAELRCLGVPYLAPLAELRRRNLLRGRLATGKERDPRLHPWDSRNQR